MPTEPVRVRVDLIVELLEQHRDQWKATMIDELRARRPVKSQIAAGKADVCESLAQVLRRVGDEDALRVPKQRVEAALVMFPDRP